MRHPLSVRRCLPVALALALALDPAGAAGQRPRGAPPVRAGAGFLTVGGQRLDLDELNRRIASAGQPEFAEDVLSLGGSGYARSQRVLVGVTGQALVSPAETTADGALRSRLTSGYGLLDLGYALYAGPRATLYPVLGIGGGATELRITERSTPTFDDVLRTPRRGSRLTAASFLLDTSLGMDVRLSARRTPRGLGGLAVGVRAGYTFAPYQAEWRLDRGGDVAAGPDAGLEGPYVRLMLGGWGERPARR